MNPLDPRVVNLWRLSALVRIVTFWVPVLVVPLGFLGWKVGFAAAGGVFVAILALQLVLAVAWPPMVYRSFGWSLREHDLLVQRGVVFRRTAAFPLDRIQHVDLRQGPLERGQGLARLTVYTAAGPSADGTIPGLALAEAEQLRDRLIRRGGDDGV